MKIHSHLLWLPALLVFAHSTPATAQSGAPTARQALDMVAQQFGPQSVQWVAEMTGQGGVPQPAEWSVLSYDARMPLLLYRFGSGMRGVSDQGPETRRYPVDIPVGYFSPNQIGVDSVAAFTIAEGEARKAKMAFDSCDYLLRVREFSIDPLWRLELLDGRRQIVGKIYISATSGTVLRTVWIYRDVAGQPRIVDSYAPGSRNLTTGITGDDFPVRGPAPGEDAGMATRRMTPDQVDGDAGIASIPPPPIAPAAPPVMSPNTGTATGPQPFRPVGPDGTVSDGGIPDPPAISGTAQTPSPPSGTGTGTGTGQMRDLREEPPAAKRPDPTKPPIDVPESSGGSSERIPPPPIPPGS